MRTIYNFKSKPCDLESVDNSEECRVVPNCSLSVKQIIERFRRTGVPDEYINSRGFYDDPDDDIDTPVYEVKDLTDLSDMSHDIINVVEKVRKESSKKLKESTDLSVE